MTVLVTGANGFLGPAVVRRVLARGERDVRCLVRPGSDASRLDGLEVAVMRGTLNSRDDCARALQDVDLVYHLASLTTGAPSELTLNGAVATRNLLDAVVAARREVRLVHCSSFGVYGVADLPAGTLLDESTPLEPHPERRDAYSHAKLRQEQVVWQYHREHRVPIVVLRPGVIYGPGGGTAISNRVGLRTFGVMLYLGRDNLLPLSFVDNCAEAIVVAGKSPTALGQVFNVVDDDLPTAREFLRRYRNEVERFPTIGLPWLGTRLMTAVYERYVDWSQGQLPAVFTRYKIESVWKSCRFDNSKLKGLGWQPPVTTAEGLRRHFEYLARH
jgi:2-alkyl-3-oxoalkanoate reductase